MKHYETYVRPIGFGGKPYKQAKAYYAKFSDLCFEDDVVDFLKEGFVYSSPGAFALARVINIAPANSSLVEPAWYIRFMCGDLYEALGKLPGYLPFIVWCRRNEAGGTKFRKFRTERLFKLVQSRRSRKLEVV